MPRDSSSLDLMGRTPEKPIFFLLTALGWALLAHEQPARAGVLQDQPRLIPNSGYTNPAANLSQGVLKPLIGLSCARGGSVGEGLSR